MTKQMFQPQWKMWEGENLLRATSTTQEQTATNTISVDTETDMPPSGVVPNSYRQQMVVLTASRDDINVVVSPFQLAQFVSVHAQYQWVFHNARFDYWVIRDELERRSAKQEILLWDRIPEENRLRDTMIMDFLYRLATVSRSEVMRMRGLLELAKGVGIYLDKEQVADDGTNVRTGFGAYLGRPISDIPRQSLDYAVMDTVAGLAVFKDLDAKIKKIAQPNKHGYLTEALQVRADIALGQIGKTGIAINKNHQQVVEERMWREIQETIVYFTQKYPLLFDYHTARSRSGPPNTVKIKKDTGLPALKRTGVLSYLHTVVAEWEIPPELIPLTPKENKKKPKDQNRENWAIALDPWRDLAKGNEFVDKWTTYADTIKQYQFVKKLRSQDIMYADYRVLLRTGRTSCTGDGGGVNIQQWPREPEMRHLFIARPGHTLIISDYSAIELRTLASVLLDRYGKSKLAEVFNTKVDPHAYTAAMFTGVPLTTFVSLKGFPKGTPERAKYDKDRQMAKPINFGVPGGLGPRRLAGYAHAEYGVEMDVEQAKVLRTRLITEVYPELGQYLQSQEYLNLANNLGCKWEDVILSFNPDHPAFWYVVQRIVGTTDGLTLTGREYPVGLKRKIWTSLASLDSGKNPELTRLIRAKRGSANLRRLLFGEIVSTRTGRLRAGADYGEARNTRFQGLAADGAKVALWQLHKEGFKTTAFIHDEVVVEVREEETETAVPRIEAILKESMASVVEHGIPIEVETKVSKQWTK